ncbi:hypothetical protein AVEN_174193-1 [Araneus ventricosus]|uniref:Uncharacterized protein n=1 Tax=Araneus ventricosus TaxID=182803 RepID=A0A4Y2UBJ7_ARAVE|nr:hypothetical protein AVEN_31482-1 [Araneus ventricosus]GBO09026.1 hypothetical protein AVEN_174193-1 [Araneus ventricosus]
MKKKRLWIKSKECETAELALLTEKGTQDQLQEARRLITRLMENKDSLVIELENIISKERVLLEEKDSQLEHLEEENATLHFMLKERKDGMGILSHVHSNEIAKAGASVLSAPLTYLELFSRAKSRNSLAHSTGASLVSGFSIRWLSDCSRQLLLASLVSVF